MLFRIASDLHLEFYKPYQVYHKDFLPPHPDDHQCVLILAGDVCTGLKYKEYMPFLRALCERFRAVVAVAGNHEFYGNSIPAAWDAMRYVEGEKWLDNFHILENDFMEFGDTVVIGSTLWTDVDKLNPLCIEQAKSGMPDFKGHIRTDSGGTPFTPNLSARLNVVAQRAIEEICLEHPNNKKVVVTHHAPSYQSVNSMFAGSRLNGAFASDLSELILDTNPNLWIHGHMHDFVDYVIGNTRIIANPFGYPKEIKNGKPFQAACFVEI